MSSLPNFLFSLLLTTIFSFSVPVIVVGAILIIPVAISYLPGLTTLGQVFPATIFDFLATFGNGSPLQGTLTIALSCCLVGGLFNLYTFYRYQYLRGH